MKRICGLFIIFFIITASSFAQTGIPRAQAMFIYNFSRLIEWPPNYKSGDFVIGIYGNSPIANELDGYTSGKRVGSQSIVVKNYNSASEISTCHILFVPFSKTRELGTIKSNLNGKSTLLVTEKNGAISDGAAINFLIIGNKLKFELNQSNASKYGIKLSSKLTEMAYKTY